MDTTIGQQQLPELPEEIIVEIIGYSKPSVTMLMASKHFKELCMQHWAITEEYEVRLMEQAVESDDSTVRAVALDTLQYIVDHRGGISINIALDIKFIQAILKLKLNDKFLDELLDDLITLYWNNEHTSSCISIDRMGQLILVNEVSSDLVAKFIGFVVIPMVDRMMSPNTKSLIEMCQSRADDRLATALSKRFIHDCKIYAQLVEFWPLCLCESLSDEDIPDELIEELMTHENIRYIIDTREAIDALAEILAYANAREMQHHYEGPGSIVLDSCCVLLLYTAPDFIETIDRYRIIITDVMVIVAILRERSADEGIISWLLDNEERWTAALPLMKKNCHTWEHDD
jgi:hypothetical protein